MATKRYVRVLASDESVARVSDTKAEWQDVEALIDGRIPVEAGLGNVVGPASSTDGHLAVFDGATGKLIKGGGAVSSVPVKASGAEADTGTDDAKFLTAKSVNDSHNVPSVAPGADGNVLTSDGTDWVSEAAGGGGVTGLTTGQSVRAASATTLETDGVKRYVALLTQTGGNAPVATVLENTLGGTVVWTRTAAGTFRGTLASAFPATKTVCLLGNGLIDPSIPSGGIVQAARADDAYVEVITYGLDGALIATDTAAFSLEIRVYP